MRPWSGRKSGGRHIRRAVRGAKKGIRLAKVRNRRPSHGSSTKKPPLCPPDWRSSTSSPIASCQRANRISPWQHRIPPPPNYLTKAKVNRLPSAATERGGVYLGYVELTPVLASARFAQNALSAPHPKRWAQPLGNESAASRRCSRGTEVSLRGQRKILRRVSNLTLGPVQPCGLHAADLVTESRGTPGKISPHWTTFSMTSRR
jgi:hypothetical protein